MYVCLFIYKNNMYTYYVYRNHIQTINFCTLYIWCSFYSLDLHTFREPGILVVISSMVNAETGHNTQSSIAFSTLV